MNLTQCDEALRFETHCGAPLLAHRPGVISITRSAEPDVAMGKTQSLDALGQPVRHTWN
jgi:hypothetical protein